MNIKRLVALAACAVVALAHTGGAQSAFDSSRAYQHLRQIVSLGPRPAGSPALDATRRYIRQQLQAIGVPSSDQRFEAKTPIGPVQMTNLVATIAGARPDRLVFAGHYDTKLFREFPFVGANDGGSSAAFLLELARVLKARRNPLTIEILFLDGEEAVGEWRGLDHTYGSRYYVEAAGRDASLRRIRGLVLLDMIGSRDLTVDRESHSTPWMLDAVWHAANKVGAADHFPQQPQAIEDDHLPFLEAGVPAVDIIDLMHYQQAGWWHTPEDTLDKTSARSLQVVGDVVMAALPAIEARLVKGAAMVAKPKKISSKPGTRRPGEER